MHLYLAFCQVAMSVSNEAKKNHTVKTLMTNMHDNSTLYVAYSTVHW